MLKFEKLKAQRNKTACILFQQRLISVFLFSLLARALIRENKIFLKCCCLAKHVNQKQSYFTIPAKIIEISI